MLKITGETPIANRLLLSLPPATLNRLMPALQPIGIAQGEIIDHVDRTVSHLYFINRGFISLVKTMNDGRTVEIGAVGIEGVTDVNALFGVVDSALLEAMVQLPGTALRVDREVLRREMARDAALRDLMQRYAHVFVNQIIQTAACNRLHSLEERCCRWLLTAHDNALADTFPLTHEFLAMMLGVQRAGVSIAAKLLQRAGLIEYRRGAVTVTDRAGLEAAACECYDATRIDLRKLVGGRKRR